MGLAEGGVSLMNKSALDMNLAYSYQIAHKNVLEEYHREPVKPVIFFETRYEQDDCFNFIWSVTLVRRQAYYVMLSGACGHAHREQTDLAVQAGVERERGYRI
jgi:hypothetical protein